MSSYRRFERAHGDRKVDVDNREVVIDAVELDLSKFRLNQDGSESKPRPRHLPNLHAQQWSAEIGPQVAVGDMFPLDEEDSDVGTVAESTGSGSDNLYRSD